MDRADSKDIIIFLCLEEELQRERKGYFDAFQRLGFTVICSGNTNRVANLLKVFEKRVFTIIQPEGYSPIHPFDVQEVQVPTVIFQWDTFTRTTIRALASLPYDIKVVCHPGYDDIFRKLGCTNTYVLPWCVDDFSATGYNDENRSFEVGWVGRFDGKFYNYRRQVLHELQKGGFLMNEIARHYAWDEMFEIYRKSKIVVNISRDDFLQDANMRCFEAMGAGALVLTKVPTELSKLGFIEGKHFVGFENLENLSEIIAYYLKNDEARQVIANAGKIKVLEQDTYFNRAKTLVTIIRERGAEVMAGNVSRELAFSGKMHQLAYTYWKEGELQKMFECLTMAKKRVTFHLFLLVIKLFLVKLKKVL